jgi:hypothetical protein
MHTGIPRLVVSPFLGHDGHPRSRDAPAGPTGFLSRRGSGPVAATSAGGRVIDGSFWLVSDHRLCSQYVSGDLSTLDPGARGPWGRSGLV